MLAKCFRFDTPKGTVIVALTGEDFDRKSIMVWHAEGPEGKTVVAHNRFGIAIMRPIFRAVQALMPEVRHWVMNRTLRGKPERVMEV